MLVPQRMARVLWFIHESKSGNQELLGRKTLSLAA
jgi:hypothetical protein